MESVLECKTVYDTTIPSREDFLNFQADLKYKSELCSTPAFSDLKARVENFVLPLPATIIEDSLKSFLDACDWRVKRVRFSKADIDLLLNIKKLAVKTEEIKKWFSQLTVEGVSVARRAFTILESHDWFFGRE